MRNRDQQKKPNWVALAVIALFVAPGVVIPIGICVGIGFLVYQSKKQNGNISSTRSGHSASTRTNYTSSAKTSYTRKQAAFDDCPRQLFCFHKDKGEHHVARGKEIDPWDRPDIDISKYQRKG